MHGLRREAEPVFLLKRYLPFYRHLLSVKWPFLVGVICGLIYAVASGAGLPLMVDIVFPVLFQEQGEDLGGLSQWAQQQLGDISQSRLLLITCAWIPAMFVLRNIAGYLNAFLIQYCGQMVLGEIRVDMFAKLQSLPMAFYHRNRSGDLLSRMLADTQALTQVLVNCSSDLIKQPVTLLAALGFLGYKAVTDDGFLIALISMFTVPICVLMIRYVGRRLAAKARLLQGETGSLTASLTESLQSSLEIRAYNLERRQTLSFREKVKSIVRLNLKVFKYRLAISPSVEVVGALGFALALFFGVRAGMSLETFLSLGMALYMSYEPIKKLGAVHAQFSQGAASLERMEYILNQPDGMPEPENPVVLGRPSDSIRYESLGFAYDDESVLKNVNVEIPVGQVVALIGPSGAGKTTFANLLPRFYDPTQGRITIDGHDLRDLSKKSLREQIAVVSQMPTLFSGTVAENIMLGKLDASKQEIETAAKRAHADEFIGQLPNGYETQVGERGDQLSGGQRQRIAIARAFLRNAPLLILDEATSALDAESESAVQGALADLVKGRTTFIIAHRFSTISIADRILVFQGGKIVADGTHEQLRNANPIYQAMAAGHVV